MAQNSVLSRLAQSLTRGLLPAALASAVLALLPLQLVSEAQEQGRGGGRGLGGGRGFGPTIIPLDGRPHIASSIKQYTGDGPAMIDSAFSSKIRLTITQQPGYQLYEYRATKATATR